MTRKPNLVKLLLGIAVLALLFIGTWATTRAPLTSAKATSANSSAPNNPKMAPGLPGPLSPPVGGDLVTNSIELDGDIVESSPGAPDDWITINCDGGNAFAKTGVKVDGNNLSIYTGGGSKDNIDIPSWQFKDGSTPPKDDMINGYAAKFLGATGDTILAFGAERSSNNGTAFIGVWFFKSSVSLNSATGGFNGVHSVGDILVLNTFTNGGSFATAKVYQWVGNGGACLPGDPIQKGGNLCDVTASAPAGAVLSVSNGAPVTIPTSCPNSPGWAPPGGTVPTNAFFEGAINIDAFPELRGSCFSSFLIETRSSAVVDAVLKDFILGQFNTCPTIEVTKAADSPSVCDGTLTTYTYVAHNPSTSTVSVTLVDDNETPCTSPNNPVGCASDDRDVNNSCATIGGGSPIPFTLQPNDNAPGGPDEATFTCSRALSVGSHHNTVTATATIGGFSTSATASADVTVKPNPSCTISGPTPVCEGATSLSYSSSATAGATHVWSITGNGTITSGNTGSGVLVTAGAIGNGTSFTLTDMVTLNGCSSSCQYIVTINPRPTATVSGGGAYCAGSGGSANISAALTGTGPWNVTWSDGVTQTGVTISPATRTVSPAGTTVYTVTAVSDANCSGAAGTGSATVTVNPNPTVHITVDTSCADQLTLTATGHGGTGPYTFKWDGVGSFTSTATHVVSTGPGSHTVEVLDANSCPVSETVNIGLCCKDCDLTP